MSRIVLFLSKRNVMIEIQRDLCLQTPSSFPTNQPKYTHQLFSSSVLDAIGKCCYIRTFSSHARAASTWGSISPGKRVIRHPVPACPVAPWSLSHPGSTFLSWWQVGGGNLKCTWPHFHRSGWWPVMTCLQRRKVSIFPWPTFEYLYWGLISINISSNCHMNICINALAQKSQQTKNEQMKMALINEKEESGLDVDFSGQLRSTFIEKLTSGRNFLLLVM